MSLRSKRIATNLHTVQTNTARNPPGLQPESAFFMGWTTSNIHFLHTGQSMDTHQRDTREHELTLNAQGLGI